MSGQVEQRRQSWRSQGSKSSAAGGASVRGRRVVWTLCLLLLLLATVLLIAYNLRKRFQHTLVASLFTASQTKTNEPEHPFTWPPLRFASETLAPLSAETTDEFQLRSLTDRFDNSENLRKAIAEHIATLQRDDALVLWIRAKGASFAGQAYLLSGDFRLPQSSAELSQPQGAVPFEAIVDAVSEWQGPTVLLLDWGNQLADARSGMWDNQFLPLVVEQLAAAPPQVYCLVSHLPGEMSLDNIPQQQTLFGRACAEALVGPRRVPDAYQPEVQSDRSLLLGDLAEYVVRRVQADSAGLQTPWLLAGGVGWASGERQAWQELTSTPLVRWGAKGRPWGWPDVAPPASEESQPQSDVGKQLDPPVFSPEADWPTAPLWLALDRWQAAEEKLGGWSLASLAPLTARRLATMTLDLENRWLAGRDFRGGGQDSAMLARIAALQQTILSQAREIQQSAAQGPVAEILSPLPAEVSPSDFARWQQQVATLAEYRQLALPLADLANLGDSLAALDKARIPAGLQPVIQGATEQVGQFLQWYRSANNGATPLLWSGATSSLQRRLQSSRQDIDRQLNELLDVARSNPRGQQLLGERLLQFCWLTQPQRRELLQAMWSAAGSPPSEAWPVRAVSLLVQPQAPQLKRSGRTLWTDLLRAGEASSEFGGPLSGQPSASAVVDALTQQAQVLRQAEQLPEASWLAVDGRDLCQKENGWPAVLQLPILPARPQPAPQWRLAWDNATGGQLSGAQLQLSSPSEPARIDLTLTRIGDAADIETIDVQLTGLLARVAGESSSWQRGELRLSGETLLRVANPRADVQRLPLEFK
ncbi:MAG: hypothetical protein KDA45_06635, partial [Planctomycetales bacterium]|nr:hypothetical protein [Planctomycetales bacterium]